MKRMPRFLFVLAAVLMLLSLAACASTPTTSSAPAASATSTPATAATATPAATTTVNPQAADAATAPASASDDPMTPEGKYPQTVEISIPKSASASPNWPAGESIDNNGMTKAILQRLNVKVKIAWEVDASEYLNKLALSLTSNALPDAFTLDSRNNYLFYKQLTDNQMLAQLDDAYAKCAGPYMKDTFNSFQNKNLDAYKVDGKMYAIADGAYGYQHELLWLRQDWMTKYNLKAPKTLDDIKNIIKTFVDNKAGGDNTLALPLDYQTPVSTIDNSMYNLGPVFESLHAFPKQWIKGSDGKVIWGSTAPEMKQALQVAADWYKEGIIDKQFPTRTANGALHSLIKSGQVGAFFAPWWGPYCWFPDFPKNVPTGELKAYDAPLDSAGNFNVMWPGPSNCMIVVNKNYAHPEAVVKMLNIEFDAWRGLDKELAAMVKPEMDAGTDWTYLFPTGGVNLEYADAVPDSAGLIKNWIDNGKMEGPYGHTETPFNQQLATDTKAYKDTKSLDGSGWIGYVGRYGTADILTAPEVKITYPAFSFVTESMGDLKANLDKLEDTTMLAIITGQQPVDSFDTFVTQWKAQGGDKVTSEVQAIVDGK